MSESNTKMKEEHIPQNILNLSEDKSYLVIKRCIDILFSILGIFILFPLFVIVAILIKLEDKDGPIFFKQVRVGKNEEKFVMYKFRSMVSNAEELLEQLLENNETTGAMFKMKKDPRVTRIGSFIRKTSIDELPQLVNVLKGQMSLVGPRPPLVREVNEYTDYDKQRLLVTPGCTGLWQSSLRNSVGFKEMVELDIEYISKRSIKLDINIMLKTIVVVIRSKAY